ncbi:pilus assembly protein TadG-related protein [Tessaracoccus sp. Y1736]
MRGITNERGAVAVIVGILMVALVGFAAIAVDVGALWLDRKELQNAADAAALALAQTCADDGKCIDGSADIDQLDIAAEYARMNTSDETSKAEIRDDQISVTYWTDTEISKTTNSVTVTVASTRTHWFAPVLEQDSKSDVLASATASWSVMGGGATLPFTVSLTCFEQLLESGKTIKFDFQEPSGPSGSDKKSEEPDEPETFECGYSDPTIVPGGFGFLTPTITEECLAETSADSTVVGGNGDTLKDFKNCIPLFADGALVGIEVLIPLFDAVEELPGPDLFHIAAYAKLKITSYCIDPGKGGWFGGPGVKCNSGGGSDGQFLAGEWIETKPVLDAELGGGSMGVKAVKLTA